MAHPPFNFKAFKRMLCQYAEIVLTIHSYARHSCNVCDAAFIIAGI